MSDLASLFAPLAIARAAEGAKNWLIESDEGFPHSWEHWKRRGDAALLDAYDREFEAPPIAGYEALERDGYVERIERRDDRIMFRITTAGRAAIVKEQSE